MRQQGRLTDWNDVRGFGFVSTLDGASRAFVHVSEFPQDKRRPALMDLLTYDLEQDDRGRPRAKNVLYLTPTRSRDSKPARSSEAPTSAIIASTAFLSLIMVLIVADVAHPGLLGIYALLSVFAFVAYAQDKSAAQQGAQRTPEANLHLLSLLGGWPGALIAQQVLRHKTRKQPFRTVFWGTVIINCIAVMWLVSLSISVPG